jgi:hypothetical protein
MLNLGLVFWAAKEVKPPQLRSRASKPKRVNDIMLERMTLAAIIGTAVIYSTAPNHSNRVGLWIAFYYTQFIQAEGNMIFSSILRNFAGQTKNSTSLAIILVAWAAGNMKAPQVKKLPRHFHIRIAPKQLL